MTRTILLLNEGRSASGSRAASLSLARCNDVSKFVIYLHDPIGQLGSLGAASEDSIVDCRSLARL